MHGSCAADKKGSGEQNLGLRPPVFLVISFTSLTFAHILHNNEICSGLHNLKDGCTRLKKRDKKYPHKNFWGFFEEPITQHPPDAHTQIHTQCEDHMGLDSIWVLPSKHHLMCPKFSILCYEFVQAERGVNRSLVLGGGGSVSPSAHHLRQTKFH